ncbi:MAG: hypothetical protein RLZZ293_308 [Pseudomonadota bacterium]|jgi:DNA processing protein
MDLNQVRQRLWIKLAFSNGVGPATALKLINYFGGIEQVFNQDITNLVQVVSLVVAQNILSDQVNNEIERALAWQQQNSTQRRILTLEDDLYPLELAQISNPPLILFAEGNLNLLKRPKIAIVGTRHPTIQGRDNALQFAQNLAQSGVCIVSGLAAGIDRLAHEGALLSINGGSTIGVIGTGIDLVYPASNRDLFQRLRSGEGLIISEFNLGTPAHMQNFPRRNRVIVGLSSACLVVESAIDGGSMISANLALEMGREVLAIPGSIHNPMARGCHKLIKQGAKLVEVSNDIFEELKWFSKSLTNTSNLVDVTKYSDHPVLKLLGYEPMSLDILCTKLEIDFSDLCGQLLELELSGQIINCGGGYYQRSTG